MMLWSQGVRELNESELRNCSHGRHLSTCVLWRYQHVTCLERRRAVCIFVYECHILQLIFFQTRIMVCDKKKRTVTKVIIEVTKRRKKKNKAVKMSSVWSLMVDVFIHFSSFFQRREENKVTADSRGRFASFLLTSNF